MSLWHPVKSLPIGERSDLRPPFLPLKLQYLESNTMANLTQKQWVLNRLETNGYITRNECLRNYISRLGAIIADLKKDG